MRNSLDIILISGKSRTAYRDVRGSPISQVLRELMRSHIAERRRAQEYQSFLQAKVEAGRADMVADKGFRNEQVEAEFTARRASVSGAFKPDE